MSVELNPTFHKYGKLACIDSGPVAGVDDYTTLAIVHGYGWHSAQFQKLLAPAEKAGVRLVLIQRRDFPGAEPLTAEDRAQLDSGDSTQLHEYARGRAGDLHGFLTAFVTQNQIPKKNGARGGIIFCIWSFAGTWMTAFVRHAPSFGGDVDLSQYIREAILYDPPFHSLGHSAPATDQYHPTSDPSIKPEDMGVAFARWISGYYTHGDTEDTLQKRTPDTDRQSTILTMQPEQVAAFFLMPVTLPGGSDHTWLWPSYATGVNASNFEAAVFPSEDVPASWAEIPMRYLWCTRSVWEMPWGQQQLRQYLDEGKASGRKMRDVPITRLDGANHFAHWDEPDRLFKALVEG